MLSIILIDHTGRKGGIVKILETAAEQQLRMVVDIMTPDNFQRVAQSQSFANAAIFVPVTGQRAFGSREGLRVGVSGESFALGQLASTRADKVILVNQPGDSLITGVDAGAAFVTGIAGIVDDRLLLTDRVLKTLLTHQHVHPRWGKMLAIGETAARLRDVQDMFGEWDDDDSNDYRLYAPCFKTCLALAQLDRLNPVKGQGHRFSYVQLARALNLARSVTGFHLSEVDLRKILSIIANRLLPANGDDSERIHLPSHVKTRWGFPRQLPVIKGISNSEMYQVLYQVCRAMELTESGLNPDPPTCVARLSSRELSRYRKVRPQKGEFYV